MAIAKFLHIFTLVSLAILHASFDAHSVNALSVERGHLGRDLGRVHAEVAKKRADSMQCRPRPSSTSAAPTTTPANSAPSPTSSQPASTNTPNSSSGSGSKVMYAFSNSEQPSLPHFLNGKRRKIYNWHLTKYVDIDIDSLNVDFVATVHGVSDMYQVPNILTKGYASYVKVLNEPEIPSQANVDPQQAFQLWMQFIEPLRFLNYNIIGPATTGAGVEWAKTFYGLCSACHIYAMDVHFYGLYLDDFKASVNTFHGIRPDLPIWITEVGCHDYSGKGQTCTQDIFNPFFSGVMDYVESTGYIDQVAWFGMFTPPEMPMGLEVVNAMINCPSGDNKNCVPNSLGGQYIGYN